jgi:hypothetical protein
MQLAKPVILFCMVWVLGTDLKAQETSNEFWPQLSGVVKLGPDFQLFGTVIEHAATDPKDRDFRIGATLAYHLKLKFHGPIARQHPEENRFFSVTGGYFYIPPAPSGTAAVENRGVFTFTGRIPWPRSLLTSDISEMDLRWISGALYWRYGNRLLIQRNFAIRSYTLTPYAFGELQYYSKYESWYRTSYGAGVRLLTTKRFEIRPYYQHENTSSGKPAHTNALGLAVLVFFRH